MKKVCLLSGMMVLGIASIDAAQRLTEEERRKIEKVQWGKIRQQKELARPAIYNMIDPLVEERDWPAIFSMLDQMQGVISVNEYRGAMGWPLLLMAVAERNFLVVKTLLEKYKANPSLQVSNEPYKGWTALEQAATKDDLAIAQLLLQYGANPYLKDAYGNDAFTYAKRYSPEILKLLQKYTRPAKAA
jgi:hypothetical protein